VAIKVNKINDKKQVASAMVSIKVGLTTMLGDDCAS